MLLGLSAPPTEERCGQRYNLVELILSIATVSSKQGFVYRQRAALGTFSLQLSL